MSAVNMQKTKARKANETKIGSVNTNCDNWTTEGGYPEKCRGAGTGPMRYCEGCGKFKRHLGCCEDGSDLPDCYDCREGFCPCCSARDALIRRNRNRSNEPKSGPWFRGT